jgi:hypothetical protein
VAGRNHKFKRTAYFDINEGWVELVADLDRRIKTICPNYVVEQVKEKFGGLRYYVTIPDGLPEAAHTAIRSLIRQAEEMSYIICEQCGADGSLRKHGWWRTFCDKCLKEELNPNG